MAYKSPEKVFEKPTRRTDMSEEKNGLKTTAELATKMDKLLLNHKSTDSGQGSFEVSFGAMKHEDETMLKSTSPVEVLETAPPLSREPLFNSDVREMINGEIDYDRRQLQPKSVVLQARQSVQSKHNFPKGNTQQDISLDRRTADHQVDQPAVGANTTADTMATHDSSDRTCPLNNTVVSSNDERAAHTSALEMNILPSLQDPKVNNTDIPTAFAEQQPSFRTTSTVLSDLPPITRGAETQQQENHRPQILQSGFLPNFTSSFGSYSQQQPMCSVAGCVSTEDNNENISLSPLMALLPMTAQPMNRHQMWQNGSAQSASSAGASGGGRQMSTSSSTSSFKSIINDDCLVKKLSWKILRHIALTLQCKYSSASWKDLVEMYGWDYHRTYLFENRYHQEGIFFSLLLEPEFQDYSLEQLRNDLFNLPRRDILNDLNKMINEHNATASGGPASQNQFY